MVKIHTMGDALRREQEGQSRSNRFYIDILKAIDIERVGYTTEDEKAIQRSDIDLFATINGKRVSISEKDRAKNFNDQLVEFYSLYPEKRGWMDNSEADYLAYFVPGKVVWINKHHLVEFYLNHLRNLPVEIHFDKLHNTGSTFSKGVLKILGRNETVSFIAAPNDGYVTMSIALSFELLKRAGVEFTLIDFE